MAGLRAVAIAMALALGVPATATAQTDVFVPQWPVALQSDVVKAARRFPGEFALVVKDLKSGVTYTYNANTPMYLASGIKLVVMVALFKQLRAGRTRLDDELIYTAGDVRDGAPLLSFLRVGTPVSIRILLEAMIQQSDNAATDMVIRHVGVENVNQVLRDEGLTGFGPITSLLDVRRLVYKEMDPRTSRFSPQDIFALGTTQSLESRILLFSEMLGEPPGMFTALDYNQAFSTYYSKGYNSAPVGQMAVLLERIAQKKMVDERASEDMIEVMLGTQTGTRRVREGLPLDTPLAHKTGTQYRRQCDFAFFYMADGRPVVFAIAVKGSGRRRGEELMSQLARRAYFHLGSARERSALSKRPPPPPLADPDGSDGLDSEENDLLSAPNKKALKMKLKSKKKPKRRRQ